MGVGFLACLPYIFAALPYMSEGSHRYILPSRFPNGLPESFIAIALREALLGLQEIHSSGMVHKSISAESIFINKSKLVHPLTIKLAYGASLYDSNLDYRDKDEESEGVLFRHTRSGDYFSDMWLVGVTALELAYGVNLKDTHREDFGAMERPVPTTKVVKKIRKSKRLPKKLIKEKQPAPTTEVVEKKKRKIEEKQSTIEKQPSPTTEVVEKKKGKMVERVQTPSIAAEGKRNNEEMNPTAEETLAKVEKDKGEKFWVLFLGFLLVLDSGCRFV
ncbi:serinethreonine-protein kinase blus1 [Nicotiana attenuata]|uniref:Serinethreonine-protein kinase blus1 n=1 Tax=Nicotiana attenuata TaxID=49451 RepID=A0A1J6IA95_NICAT|nr:serinethreonine-protein kinase blus1 [Nicotiana attenuata]